MEARIETMEFPNKGIVHIDGEKVVIKNGIPGQMVRFGISKRRKGKCEARLIQVLEPSPLEVPESRCVHAGICGGCLYQGLPYREQLQIKEQQVRKLLDGAVEPGSYVLEPIKGSPLAEAYRNKMEFSFGDAYKDGPLALGMHKRGSFYDIVTTRDCRIVHPDFCRILTETLEYFRELGVGYYRKLQHTGYLRHLLVRLGVKTGEILVALVTSGQVETLPSGEEALLEGWRDRMLGLAPEGAFAGILHIRNDSLADVVQSDSTEVLWGREYFFEELLGLKFKITPFSFFQTNSLGAEVLYDTVRSFVEDAAAGGTREPVLFDLYSGTGTIAQVLAPVADRVIGVEIVEEAVEAARENAALNGLTNCEFIAGDVLKVLDSLTDRPQLVILDPPRDGIHPKALEKIGDGIQPRRMIYISCKPTSLARDLVPLQAYGYQVERVCCVDMFPGTGNVETVVLLSKLKPDDIIEVKVDLDELDATTAETKATYPEIKEYVLQKYGLKAHTAYIAQVKRKYGIDMRKNYNVSKKENPKARPCPANMEEAIYDALKLFAMV